MANFGNYTGYQTLHEDEAIQIALSESLQLYHDQYHKENEDLAMAIRLSLINTTYENDSCCDTDSDCCSEPGVVRWEPDGEEKIWEAEENTLIRETDHKGQWTIGGELELRVVEGISDEEEDVGEEPEEDMQKENRDIDVWKYFELSQQSRATTHNNTFSDKNYDDTEVRSDTSPGNISPRSENFTDRPATAPSNHVYEELVQLGYPVNGGTITVPDLGTFKIKKNFKSLVSAPMIKRMLAQTSNDTRYPSDNRILTPTNPNIPKHSPSKVKDTPLVYSGSPSKPATSQFVELAKQNFTAPLNFFPEKEEQRRVKLYNSLVRAQRRYAEKLCTPYGHGPSGSYTAEEWNSLGDQLQVEDWEAGFLIENVTPYKLEKTEEGSALRWVVQAES